MEKRPYFKFSIIELEKVFESSNGDIRMIEDIHNELKFRNTHRALLLKRKVEEYKSNKQEISQNIDNNQQYPRKPSNTDKEETRKNESEEINTEIFERMNKSKDTVIDKKIPICNENYAHPGANNILSAWLTTEVLAPQSLPNAQELEAINRKLVRLDEVPEPWNDKKFWKKGKETSVFWMVYLGELNLSKAVESILKAFPDESADEKSDIRGNTTLAVIVLDSKGCPVKDKTFLSSFAWGYGKVRAGKLKELAEFVDAERAIKSKIEDLIIRQNDQGENQAVSVADINRVTNWLMNELNIPHEEVLSPGCSVRVPQYSLYSEPPEPELLNSFFINDIFEIRNSFSNGNVGKALKTYMALNEGQQRQDVVKNKKLLSETLAPFRMPLTRWTCRGRYPLFLMQQAAINHAVKELENGGLVAVNGPPGTGKTTLLRDIIAKVVLDRAIAMAKFEKPESAFKHIASMKTGKAFTHLYQIDDSLLGHEIVVASSNNKAVENISCEIPASKAIADDFENPLNYFQSISDAIAAGNKEKVETGATWGLTAAVLGNNANKSAFINSFWWNKQRSMASYLSAIIGGNFYEEDEELENNEQSYIPEVVRLETPPKNEIEAFENWQAVRADFLKKLERAEEIRNKAQEVYDAVNIQSNVEKELELVKQDLTKLKNRFNNSQEILNNTQIAYDKALINENKTIENQNAIELLRPGLFARLFKTASYKDWHRSMVTAVNDVQEASKCLKESKLLLEQLKSEYNSIKSRLLNKEKEKLKIEQIYESIKNVITEGEKEFGKNFVDDAFWTKDDKELQVLSPWISKELQQARDELFKSAFDLHKAFINSTARFMKHNLRAVMDVMKGRALSEKQEPARRSLWASLFIAVPVISTTFASTSRLFGMLGREQLGWLLIDEAGQATPQAALGALWRSKRAIIIGDPLQIEPVVTIPPKLINSIFKQFEVSYDDWAPPQISAQILADRSSWFGTTIDSEDGELWVGSPLRVHRRCEKPMFSISNYIAYNGLMVYGTQESDSSIGNILGSSRWININGNTSGKWSDDEGIIVLKILKKLLDSGISDPDIFFITPFRMVAFKLRELIRSDEIISKRLPQKAWEWTNERVGTIHTFQGKEADTVVLVLGAPLASSGGARRWAGGNPNLLNVAVTRAKRRIYVIGNHEAWKNEGYFKYLASSLPVKI